MLFYLFQYSIMFFDFAEDDGEYLIYLSIFVILELSMLMRWNVLIFVFVWYF